MNPSKKINQVLLHFILVVSSIFLAGTILELLLSISTSLHHRFISFTPEQLQLQNQQQLAQHYSTEYTYKPYLLWKSKPNQSKQYFSTNPLGFRGPKFSLNKPPNTYRIIFTGGSVAWGYGASSNQQTISYQLETLLNQHYSNKFEVLNLAEDGYTSTQEAILWLTTIPQYHPDLVIHFTGFNDLYTGQMGKPAGWNHPFIQESLLTKSGIFPSLQNMLHHFAHPFSQTHTAQLITHLLLSTNPPRQFTDLENISTTFLKNTQSISILAQPKQIPVVFILQPNLYTKHPLTFTELSLALQRSNYYPNQDLSGYYLEGNRRLFSALLSIDSPSIYILDTSNVFNSTSKNQPVYFDSSHYYDHGYQFIAKIIYQFLVDNHLTTIRSS